MKIISLNKDTEYSVLLESVMVLKTSGIIVAPTDTVYGIITDATNEETVKKIFTLKGRPPNKPIPVLIDSFKMLNEVAYVKDKKINKFLERVWPGKTTCVLPSRGWMPLSLRAGGLNIGVRMPNHNFLLSLIKSFGKPITGTSANISGYEETLSPEDLKRQFQYLPAQPDLILDAGELIQNKVSTVLDLTKDEPEIIREGPVSKEEIYKIWSSLPTF